MKYLALLMLSILLIDSNSQLIKSEDEYLLEKYSYLMVGIKTLDNAQVVYPLGTCFFVRRAKDLFLITAKHNINGYNTFNKNPTLAQFDTVGFRYYNFKTKQTCFSSLNILPIKKWLPNDYFYESPDLVVMQMRDTSIEKYINSLESYIFESKKDGEILENVIAIGYAFQDPKTFSLTTLPTFYEGFQVNSLNNKDPFYPINDSIYYTVQPKTIQGMSGSPVFLRYSSKRKKKHFLFGGVLFGTNTNYNCTYIVNPNLVKSQLMEFVLSPK